ncbi:MAG: hypothetical protein ACOC98_03690 [Thermodesulfobacteriota bacterium]
MDRPRPARKFLAGEWKVIVMQTIIINIHNEALADKVTWLLEHFQAEGLEIVSKEDLDDLKLLKATRGEETIPFDEFLKNENIDT